MSSQGVVTHKKVSYSLGLSPIKGKKFSRGTRTGSRDEFLSLSLGITKTTPLSPVRLKSQRPSLLHPTLSSHSNHLMFIGKLLEQDNVHIQPDMC